MIRESWRFTRRAVLRAALGLAMAGGAALLAGDAFAKQPAVYTGRFGNLAIGGYDPVAYFKEGKPVEGSRQFTSDWNGATWRFASQDNLNAFKADPQRYAPQYGGYCAWAVGARNQLAAGDPQYWRIVDGKLFLNYDKSVQEKWEKDVPGFIKAANTNWPGVLDRN